MTDIQEVQNFRNYVPKVHSFVLILGPSVDKRVVNLFTEDNVYFLYIFASLDEISDPILQNCTNTISGNVRPSCAAYVTLGQQVALVSEESIRIKEQTF